MLLSSSNRKYPPLLLLSYFSVVVYLGYLLHHILSLIAYTFRENREFVFIIIVQFMMSANSLIRFGLQIVLACLYSTPSHYHHCANLSEDIGLIWNACQIYFVECVSKIKHILSVIHYTICGAVCFQFTHFPCDDWENIYTLSYYHHQIGNMNYQPLFRVRSWNNVVRCMSFYILTISNDIHVGLCAWRYYSFPQDAMFQIKYSNLDATRQCHRDTSLYHGRKCHHFGQDLSKQSICTSL